MERVGQVLGIILLVVLALAFLVLVVVAAWWILLLAAGILQAIWQHRRDEANRVTVTVDGLGEFTSTDNRLWSEEEDGYIGTYGTRRFLINDAPSADSDALYTYAHEIIRDPDWLNNALSRAKSEAMLEFEEYYADEIAGLTYGTISFYIHSGQHRIFAQLEGGRDYRCWRMEFSGREYEGIGFDD